MSLPAGTRLGRYEIRAPLGAGGMGEVYRAQDTKLLRTVALKILPEELAQDKQRMKRFGLEARAASALNHPSILTIYEIDEVRGVHFMATEFIDGKTLRQHLAKGPMKPMDALEVAFQMASALAAAHAAGIIHRDIKPENIMLRPDGYAKVLDFGLVKLTKHQIDCDVSTLVQTNAGVVMGTVGYMSPEQVRGIDVDARTDIWSLGVVLYEMFAGRAPFEADNVGDVMAAILDREPAPLSLYAPGAPAELQRIVRKSLRKDREERYQIIKELALDLKNLRRDLELEGEWERSLAPVRATDVKGPGPPKTVTEPGEAGSASSAEYLVNRIKRHKVSLGIASAIVGVLILFLAYWQMPQRSGMGNPSAPLEAMRIGRLTATGKASRAAISPDGKYVVHVAAENGQQSLRVRQANTTSDVQIVPPAQVRYEGLTFSRDGDFVYYVISECCNPLAVLYKVPVLGGAARKIISDVGSAVTLSPDGKYLAFIRNLVEQGEQVLVVASVEGAGERVIAVRKFPNFFRSVSWSPDGKSFACGAGSYVPTYNSYVVVLPVDGGPERQISSQVWFAIGQVAWLRDGDGLILNASDSNSASFDALQLWYLSTQSGKARRITNDLNDYSSVSLTADSSRLVTVQSEALSNIWIVPRGEANRAVPLTNAAGQRNGKEGICWTPDGKIVFVSTASGNDDIWIMNGDGSNQRQLTSNAGINNNPAVSPDGRFIVFTSTRTGASHIWRMDIDGANAKQLTSGSTENYAQVSSDGKWVVYTLFSGKPTLWRVSIEGGEPIMVSGKSTSSPAISPDGKWIASVFWDVQPNSPPVVSVIPFEGGETLRVFDPLWGRGGQSKSDWRSLRWMPDGRGIAYALMTGGVSNVWTQPLVGGEPKQLTDFKTDNIFWFDWSRDGSQIACARGAETNDVVLISNFK